MPHRLIRTSCLLVLAISFLWSALATGTASASAGRDQYYLSALLSEARRESVVAVLLRSMRPYVYRPQGATADFPTVDPDYIYNQLYSMVTHYQHREAGYDKNLPVNVNGHDEFATYWAQEMVRDLQGFGPQVKRDPFPVKGWTGRPATVPAFNVEVSVPGALHPEQVVVIGCHYDGEAISTQSANDDGSGCAIELGVARALGNYWHSHHLYPARTLRFVIFDAEEQGLFGSFHYLDSTVNGDVQNVVAMFNEEQNGIAYPLRYLGKLSNPLLPFYIDMSPLKNNFFYPHQNQLSAQQKANITHFRALMQQAVPVVFQQFQAMGFATLNYQTNSGQSVSQPVFASDQQSNIRLEDDTLGGSDEIPFTQAGLPAATFLGNFSYYDRNPPPWSYPFDQRQDTIQLMNTFASGSAQKAPALVLSLALPGMLTTWMLHQPDILGEVDASRNAVQNLPIVSISDIGQTQVGKSLALNAEVDGNSSVYSYTWNFGDGSSASGPTASHVYAATGNYALSLTVKGAHGSRQVLKTIHVMQRTTVYPNPYAAYPSNGNPPSNPQVILPVANNGPASGPTPTSKTPLASSTPTVPVGWWIGLGLLIVLVAGGILFFVLRRKPVV